jgi:hypothetical protein
MYDIQHLTYPYVQCPSTGTYLSYREIPRLASASSSSSLISIELNGMSNSVLVVCLQRIFTTYRVSTQDAVVCSWRWVFKNWQQAGDIHHASALCQHVRRLVLPLRFIRSREPAERVSESFVAKSVTARVSTACPSSNIRDSTTVRSTIHY